MINFEKKRPSHYWNKTRAIEHPTIFDIAWAAGIYEGEGCVILRRDKGWISIHVNQNDPWLVEKLIRLFGGSKFTGKTPKGKPHFRWDLHGARACGFLLTVYKFLSPRKQQKIKEAIKHEAYGGY
jgi:hypothetical protein